MSVSKEKKLKVSAVDINFLFECIFSVESAPVGCVLVVADCHRQCPTKSQAPPAQSLCPCTQVTPRNKIYFSRFCFGFWAQFWAIFMWKPNIFAIYH